MHEFMPTLRRSGVLMNTYGDIERTTHIPSVTGSYLAHGRDRKEQTNFLRLRSTQDLRENHYTGDI